MASRLVERWRRPCVVIALDSAAGTSAEALHGRGSGRSISASDLHAGLAACSEHLIRFGGHRMAAGVELGAGSVDAFRRALAAHAAAALSPDDLIPVERVDAVVPGGDLGLDPPRTSSGSARSAWATPSRLSLYRPPASSG